MWASWNTSAAISEASSSSMLVSGRMVSFLFSFLSFVTVFDNLRLTGLALLVLFVVDFFFLAVDFLGDFASEQECSRFTAKLLSWSSVESSANGHKTQLHPLPYIVTILHYMLIRISILLICWFYILMTYMQLPSFLVVNKLHVQVIVWKRWCKT